MSDRSDNSQLLTYLDSLEEALDRGNPGDVLAFLRVLRMNGLDDETSVQLVASFDDDPSDDAFENVRTWLEEHRSRLSSPENEPAGSESSSFPGFDDEAFDDISFDSELSEFEDMEFEDAFDDPDSGDELSGDDALDDAHTRPTARQFESPAKPGSTDSPPSETADDLLDDEFDFDLGPASSAESDPEVAPGSSSTSESTDDTGFESADEFDFAPESDDHGGFPGADDSDPHQAPTREAIRADFDLGEESHGVDDPHEAPTAESMGDNFDFDLESDEDSVSGEAPTAESMSPTDEDDEFDFDLGAAEDSTPPDSEDSLPQNPDESPEDSLEDIEFDLGPHDSGTTDSPEADPGDDDGDFGFAPDPIDGEDDAQSGSDGAPPDGDVFPDDDVFPDGDDSAVDDADDEFDFDFGPDEFDEFSDNTPAPPSDDDQPDTAFGSVKKTSPRQPSPSELKDGSDEPANPFAGDSFGDSELTSGVSHDTPTPTPFETDGPTSGFNSGPTADAPAEIDAKRQRQPTPMMQEADSETLQSKSSPSTQSPTPTPEPATDNSTPTPAGGFSDTAGIDEDTNPFAHEAPTGIQRRPGEAAFGNSSFELEEIDEEASSSTDPTKAIASTLDEAQSLLEDGAPDEAMELVEAVLEIDEDSEDALELEDEIRDHLETDFINRLGSLRNTPELAVSMGEVADLDLDHRAGFLLSQIDGMLTFEDILDMSAMSRFETLEVLVELKDEGILSAQ